MRDFHLPLRSSATASFGRSPKGHRRPAPNKPLRKARHDQIAAYAAEMAGTDLDLDPIWKRLESRAW